MLLAGHCSGKDFASGDVFAPFWPSSLDRQPPWQGLYLQEAEAYSAGGFLVLLGLGMQALRCLLRQAARMLCELHLPAEVLQVHLLWYPPSPYGAQLLQGLRMRP